MTEAIGSYGATWYLIGVVMGGAIVGVNCLINQNLHLKHEEDLRRRNE